LSKPDNNKRPYKQLYKKQQRNRLYKQQRTNRPNEHLIQQPYKRHLKKLW
jgi:hypothetical protein